MRKNTQNYEYIRKFQDCIDLVSDKLRNKYKDKILDKEIDRFTFILLFYILIHNFFNRKLLSKVFKKGEKLIEGMKWDHLSWGYLKEYLSSIFEYRKSNFWLIGKPEFENLWRDIINDDTEFGKFLIELIKNNLWINEYKRNNRENLIELVKIFDKIYENFLKSLENKDNQTKVRKRFGIYYTPRNVARYVIKKVFTSYLETHKINTIRDLLKLKILDPSMGTGNFLLEAMEYLMEYARSVGINDVNENIKELIFKNSIYGVDIDPIAVEITKWGIFFYINTDDKIFKKLDLNLKVGNSLLNIFYTDLVNMYPKIKDMSIKKDNLGKIIKLYIISCIREERYKRCLDLINDRNETNNILETIEISDQIKEIYNKIFLWEFEFPEVFMKDNNNGFDIIIGNPPHIENKKINENDKKFLKKSAKNYMTTLKLYDYTVPFIELSYKLLKNSGVLGFITANKFLSADYGYTLRKMLLQKVDLLYLIDISRLHIFHGILSYPIIICFRKRPNDMGNKNKVILGEINEPDINSIDNNIKFYSIEQNYFEKIPNYILPLSHELKKLIIILNKENMVLLQDVCRIDYRPLKFTNWGKFLKDVHKDKEQDKGKSLKFVACGSIEQFGIDWNKNIRLLRNNYKNTFLYRPVNINKKKWEILEKPKILIREIALNLTAAFDEKGEYGNLTGMYIVYDFKISPYYLLAILNSRVMDWIYKILFGSVHLQGGYLNFHSSYLKVLPIIIINEHLKDIDNISTNINLERLNMSMENWKTEIDGILDKKDFKPLYYLIIKLSKKLSDLTSQKHSIINEFHSFINYKLKIEIIKFKKKTILINYYKYSWEKIEEILVLNKKHIGLELEYVIKRIFEKYKENIKEYRSLKNEISLIKTMLDYIIEYLYMN
ncbi:MAG: Eco57I restriction-modification methylase domain-containing protein [Candidatus Helarchaeota archaeon]